MADFDAVGELDGQEDRMLHLVPDVRRSYVVIESLRVVLDNDLAFALALVLPLDELFLNVIVSEGLNKRTELLLLVVACRPPRVHEDRRTNHCRKHLRFLELALVYVKHD
jgi:hypothetical protein